MLWYHPPRAAVANLGVLMWLGNLLWDLPPPSVRNNVARAAPLHNKMLTRRTFREMYCVVKGDALRRKRRALMT